MASNDVLSSLVECSFRGISFPIVMIGTTSGHKTVPHARVDRNGERVENLGRKSRVFKFKAPFINTIVRGTTETWTAGALYPDTYFKVIATFEDRSSGPFQHPIYGARNCKVLDYDDALDPEYRGGPTLTAILMESVDDGDQAALTQASSISIATAAAFTLDATLGLLTPPPVTGTPAGMSLTDFVKSIGALGDRASLFTQQVMGKIDSVVNALTVLGSKFGATPGFSDATNRLISALHTYRLTFAVTHALSFYVVPKTTTLATIANRVGRSVADLLVLNPRLAAFPLVPAQTIVRFASG